MIKRYEFKCNNKKVLVYNCCEHEFSIATETKPGANPYDEFFLYDDIKSANSDHDYIIVVYHGGKECYRYPSPLLQKRCRRIIYSVADLVICQHSHCIGCKEEYIGGTIIYGQGNFIFNKISNEYWNTSLLIKIEMGNKPVIKYVPLLQTDNGVKLAQGEIAKKIISDFLDRTEEIKGTDVINKKYEEFAAKNLDNYIIMLSSNSTILRVIRKIMPGLFRRITFKYASVLNVVECESHRELAIEGLKGAIKGKKR